ncbi:Fur family transcriptional regulator [Spirillospora sp. NPDC127200]
MVDVARTNSTPTRTTWQQKAVRELLENTEGFQSAQTLFTRLREQGSTIGLATVYRTLQSLADAGAIDVTQLPHGESVFRRCNPGHHHHLICRSCGATVEVEGPPAERWVSKVSTEHGFTDVDHTIEIIGLCPRCTG